MLWTIPFPFLQWILVFVGAALSGSVIVLALWKPLHSHQRGIALILVAIVLALHFLLAAGLELYFFRYAKVAAAHTDVERSATTQLNNLTDKVTELKPLSLVLEENLKTNFNLEAHSTSENLTVIDSSTREQEESTMMTKVISNSDVIVVENINSTVTSSSSTDSNKVS